MPQKASVDWDDLKSELTSSFTQEDWDEINFKVKIVGEIINARQEEHLTQQALEKLSGVRQPMIARIETGDTDPRLGTVLRILRPLGKTLRVVDIDNASSASDHMRMS